VSWKGNRVNAFPFSRSREKREREARKMREATERYCPHPALCATFSREREKGIGVRPIALG
jgi:hypothetical protein